MAHLITLMPHVVTLIPHLVTLMPHLESSYCDVSSSYSDVSSSYSDVSSSYSDPSSSYSDTSSSYSDTSSSYSDVSVCSLCVCCFVLLNRYWGIVTVPVSISYGSRPGVAGSSPSTLTTSLATPVPCSSSSNGPTTTPLTTKGFYPGDSVVWAGPKFVRPHW